MEIKKNHSSENYETPLNSHHSKFLLFREFLASFLIISTKTMTHVPNIVGKQIIPKWNSTKYWISISSHNFIKLWLNCVHTSWIVNASVFFSTRYLFICYVCHIQVNFGPYSGEFANCSFTTSLLFAKLHIFTSENYCFVFSI